MRKSCSNRHSLNLRTQNTNNISNMCLKLFYMQQSKNCIMEAFMRLAGVRVHGHWWPRSSHEGESGVLYKKNSLKADSFSVVTFIYSHICRNFFVTSCSTCQTFDKTRTETRFFNFRCGDNIKNISKSFSIFDIY